MRETKQLTVFVLLTLACVGDVSWALAVRALAHGPHVVSLAMESTTDIVLHHHDLPSEEHAPHRPMSGHHDDQHEHGDHVISRGPASAAASRRFAPEDGPSAQQQGLLAIDAVALDCRLALCLTAPRSSDRSPPRRTIVLRI